MGNTDRLTKKSQNNAKEQSKVYIEIHDAQADDRTF